MRTILKLLRFWPPYLAAGICVKNISLDVTSLHVEMKLRFWNKNAVGTHFGGSLYSMVDPFFMLMLMHNLGKDYIVWDKAAFIQFKKPGLGTVRAEFHLSKDLIADIKKRADHEPKVEPKFVVNIYDESGDVVAMVEKTLYVRSKNRPIRD